MKSSIWLRNIFSVAYYLMITGWIMILGLFIFSLFGDFKQVLLIINDPKNIGVESREALFTILIYALISGAFWIYALRLGRNLMDSLMSGILFTRLQVASFKIIGQIILLLTIIDALSSFLFKIIFHNELEVRFEFSNFWFAIAIGLFMIFLSNIFAKAHFYKEENELTI